MQIRLAAAVVLAVSSMCAGPRYEFVFTTAPFRSAHASTIVELRDGDLLAAWFGGSAEGHADVAIWGARRSSAGWSIPFELAREPGVPCYNPVLFYSADGTLWLYYRFGPKPDSWSAARKSSRDGGHAWSATEYLPAGVLGPIKNKPLLLKGGTLIAGTSVESYRAWTSWAERSTDGGRSWTRHGPILYPGENYGTIQPTVVQLANGVLRMFVRATEKIGSICYADSWDGGVTWSEAKRTELPNPNSGIDAVRLADGRVVLVYNASKDARTPLSVGVSSDGLAFRRALDLETAEGEYSYPAVIQAVDGSIHVTYTWKRQRIRHATIALSDLEREK